MVMLYVEVQDYNKSLSAFITRLRRDPGLQYALHKNETIK